MKILIVPSWYPTEENPILGIFFKEQAKALAKNGCNISVLYPEIRSIRYYQSKWKKGITVKTEDGIRTYRYKCYNPFPARVPYSTAFSYYFGLKRLYKLMRMHEEKPDIIHAHSCLWGGWAAAKIAQKENIPIVITEHSSKFLRNQFKDYEISEIKKTLAKTDIIISVGPTLKKSLEKFTNKNIHEIPNIVRFEDFQIDENNNTKEKDEFIFFSLAILTPNKGMDVLIKSFARAFKKQPGVKLVIGGDGPHKSELIQLTHELGIESQVQFLGALDRKEVILHMNKCDAFVLASKFETFGVVFIEALSCGKPIISTKSGGPNSIVNSKNGLLVSVNNIEELSDAMLNLYRNYSQYNSEDIRNDCYERFSEPVITKQILDLYKSIKT